MQRFLFGGSGLLFESIKAYRPGVLSETLQRKKGELRVINFENMSLFISGQLVGTLSMCLLDTLFGRRSEEILCEQFELKVC